MVNVAVIDHTADIGLQVKAPTAPEAFAAVAVAMFDILVTPAPPLDPMHVDLVVEADDWEDLLVVWLEELLYRYESERVVASEIKVRQISAQRLRASLDEEPLDMVRHEPRVQIKAVTYHQLVARETQTGFEIQVIFDI